MSKSFVHLHTHTEFSLLDGAARIEDIVNKIKADGQPAIGCTDHGNLYGAIEFYKTCKANDIKPIIGTEAYMAYDTRYERLPRKGKEDDLGGGTGTGRKQYYHLTLLSKNETGYKNLIQLSSRAFLEGYYFKPRVDWDLLAEHSEGLIATTGCLGGHVLQSLLNDDFDMALNKAAKLQEIFGKENLFVEIQNHGLKEQIKTNPELIRIANKLNAPLLATNDSHYVDKSDAVSHDALLCVQVGARISDKDRFHFEGCEHYVKTSDEMRTLFNEHEDACDNSLLIAEKCELEIPFGVDRLPKFPVPDGFADDSEYLENLSFKGAAKRFGDILPDEVIERLIFELKVIKDMGFSSYFLVVFDLVNFAHENNIRVGPGRGSACGCLVSYALGITDIDPIKNDLIFERFLNPSRVSMPDIDMDFDSRYRDTIINYAASKYGKDRVAQIITFSTIKARAAIRDSARVLNKPFSLGDQVSKLVPSLVMGRDTPLFACFKETDEYEEGYARASELRKLHEDNKDVHEIIEVAKGLEGMRRQDGIHAAAVVISPEPLTNIVPVQRKSKPTDTIDDVPIVIQYDMAAVEDLGLLKMDILGLRNLDIISDTVDLIKQNYNLELDISSIPLDDKKTFALLQEADTTGVFQLESSQMKSLIKALYPETFDDIAALVALYRPGPMSVDMHLDYADRKNKRKEIEYFHPEAKEILSETYGLMIYQESMMKIAQHFAGYSLAEADNLRKACGKKIKSLMSKEKEKFIQGVIDKDYGEELGIKLFDIINNFANYAFNKSHSYGYGLLAYQTAFLKANYPLEYFAALLTAAKDTERSAKFLSECRSHSVIVTIPDINKSIDDFIPYEGKILFGLSSIRNVGITATQKILDERNINGLFKDFYDFCYRMDGLINKKVIESLIKAGAFETFGYPRQGLLVVSSEIIGKISKEKKKENKDHNINISIPDIEYDKKEKISLEKEMLGLYVSDHPLLKVDEEFFNQCDVKISELNNIPHNDFVNVGGVITNIQKKRTRKGDLMGIFNLEDLEDSIEAIIFPQYLQSLDDKLNDDGVVVLNARVDTRDETPKLIVQNITPFTFEKDAKGIIFRMSKKLFDKKYQTILDIIKNNPGDKIVSFQVENIIYRMPNHMSIDLNKFVNSLKLTIQNE